jgi:hypothetical protein
MSERNDNNLINFIATTVETMREQMATKDDIVRLESRMETMREQMATKEELATLRDQMVTKDELATLRDQMATKKDLARVESTLDSRTTAIRGDIEQVHIRLDSIDRRVDTRMAQTETEISRLRSVLYLLVKDKPDMLRLLGWLTPDESRPQG